MTIIYKAKDVMEKLDLKESVFKKYIGLLEREGYVVQKNQQGHRLFNDDDIKTLEAFIELSKYDGMTLEAVAKKIGTMKKKEGHEVIPDKSHDVMSLVEIAVSDALEKQEKRFMEHVERRDKLLMESMREQQELKKLMLETQKMIAASVQKEEKKTWWRFWK